MKIRQKRAIWYTERKKELNILAKGGAKNIHGNTWLLPSGKTVIGRWKAVSMLKQG